LFNQLLLLFLNYARYKRGAAYLTFLGYEIISEPMFSHLL